MASLPPRSSPAGRNRGSGSRQSDPSSSSDTADVSQSSSHIDRYVNDSQAPETVFPDRTRSSPAEPDSATPTQSPPGAIGPEVEEIESSAPVLASSSSSPVPPGRSEPRKCWICYTDETEDTPMNREWRSPCPCALTAHEACLLDWLADMENPKSPRRTAGSAKMLCPQCKCEIVVARPRSLLVDFVRLAERMAGRLVLPGVAFTLAGTVWAGCCAHGVSSMYLVFGREEMQRIFESSGIGRIGSRSAWNPRLNIGVPLIPLVLIFSRTRYAEGLLPAIPVLFFATHHPGGHELELDMWPPSPAITFAALPYVKSVYGMLYERLFGKLERKWLAEVQPRSENDSQQTRNDADDGREQGPDGEVLMEIELQVGVGNLQDHLRGGEDRGGNEQGAEGGAAGQDQAGQQQADEGQANQLLGRRQDNIIHESSSVADTVLGALLFPAISASMGGILKLALPRTWTSPFPVPSQPSSFDKATKSGLLHTKWGRSVVGGCLFVLIKDALVLYCRWKLAQSHRKRKVLNYDRTKGKVVPP